MDDESTRLEEDCETVFERLSEYLDAELPGDLCSQIERHMEHCVRCAETLEGLRRTVAICRGYQGNQAPNPVRNEMREQLLAAYQMVLSRRR